MNTNAKCLVALLSAALFSLTGFTAVVAEEATPDDTATLDEVVVVAQKRAQNLQDVPVAVTAISSEMLENQHIVTFNDLARVAPGLTITESSNVANSSINLRGIGTFVFSTGLEPAVSVIVDDVPIVQTAQAFTNLSDIERVEVLRGPQGTLFGKSASAGVINVVTKGPSDTFTASAEVTATSDDEYRLQSSVSGPFGDVSSSGFRLSGFTSSRDGYIRNLTTGTSLNNDKGYGIRGRVDFKVGARADIQLIADHSNKEQRGPVRTFGTTIAGSTVFGSPLAPSLLGVTPGLENFNVRQDVDPLTTSRQSTASGRLTYHLASVDLTSVTSYQNWDYTFLEDVDSTAAAASAQSGPFNSHQFGQELRLASTDGGQFDYLVGLYYSDASSSRTFRRGPIALANWSASNGSKTSALFGQVDFRFTDRTRMSIGARANQERISVRFTEMSVTPNVSYAGNNSESKFTGKIALQHDLADGVMSYVSYARGYKGQGYDISSGFNQSRVDRPVKAEDSNAYELGLKSRLLDNRLQLNAALFLTDYNNFQAQSAILLPSGVFQAGVNNVGILRTQGVELELSFQASANLRIDASAAFTDAKIKEFPTANCYSGQTVATGCRDVDGAGPLTNLVQDLAGKRLSNSPTSKFSLSANYSRSVSGTLDGNASLDYQYQSDVNFDLYQNPRAVQSAYGVLNGSIGIRTSGNTGYRVSAFVNNLLDKQYVTTIGDAGGASLIGNTLQLLPRNASRYVGLKVGYQF